MSRSSARVTLRRHRPRGVTEVTHAVANGSRAATVCGRVFWTRHLLGLGPRVVRYDGKRLEPVSVYCK